jgi:hypothetical protein
MKYQRAADPAYGHNLLVVSSDGMAAYSFGKGSAVRAMSLS